VRRWGICEERAERLRAADVVAPEVGSRFFRWGESCSDIAQAAINADGSFAGTASQSGVLGEAPAKFTYSFAGSFEGADRQGATIVAGLLREDIVVTDSAGTHNCTSNAQPWIATD
jgi:hypothetical protein